MVIIISFASCGRPEPPAGSAIAPVAGQPSPLPADLSTVGREPRVTTAGSPAPWPNRHAEFETVTIHAARIDARHLIPRMNVPFRIINADTATHALVLSGGGRRTELPPLAPGREYVLPFRLIAPSYTWTCRLPGHLERGSFDTYVPH